MKSKQKTRKNSYFSLSAGIYSLLILLFVVLGSIGYSVLFFSHTALSDEKTDTVTAQTVSSQIQANGTVTPQTQATLHFQTGGKLVYLPFQKGDTISQGQTIAQLDTYQLQRQLTIALNNYKNQRDQFAQSQEYNSSGVLSNEQSTALKNAGAGIGGDTNSTIVNDTVKQILDENQNNLNTSVVNVELANYAVQLSTLTSPISGVITNEDVTVAGQNITPTTGFTVADPSSLVFRANITENDIDYVSQGAYATVQIDGMQTLLNGTVSKVYPNKQTLANGQTSYQVDITLSSTLHIKMDQTGIATITSSAGSNVLLIPTWTIVNHQYVWVEENGKAVFKQIQTGQIHGTMTEVTGGLTPEDSVIINPAAIVAGKYSLL